MLIGRGSIHLAILRWTCLNPRLFCVIIFGNALALKDGSSRPKNGVPMRAMACRPQNDQDTMLAMCPKFWLLQVTLGKVARLHCIGSNHLAKSARPGPAIHIGSFSTSLT